MRTNNGQPFCHHVTCQILGRRRPCISKQDKPAKAPGQGQCARENTRASGDIIHDIGPSSFRHGENGLTSVFNAYRKNNGCSMRLCHLQTRFADIDCNDLPRTQETSILDSELTQESESNHHYNLSQCMLSTADTILRNCCQTEPGSIFISDPLGDRIEVTGRDRDKLAVGPAYPETISFMNLIDTRSDRHNLSDHKITGMERIDDPTIPMRTRLKQATQTDALRSCTNQRLSRLEYDFPRSRVSHRFFYELNLVFP